MIKKMEQDEELRELFTKKEEYGPIRLDRYGRFSYYLSSQRNVFEPEVSNFLIKEGLNPEYPEGRKFAVCLTHDINFVYPGIMNTAARTKKLSKRASLYRPLFFHFQE
ncbi:MAG TPA: hypothetical protein GXX65_07295 [Methanosarcina sp.]|nr:hypothetical protein [Methanosarcina sp.]HHV24334.1 hypothetical protein [Methanosarcina sp.]